MTPMQLKSFHAVATTGSFTSAAKMLNISQPPVTTHVRQLEERYGVELFHRHSRGTELTQIGRELLAIAQRIVANQLEAVDYLKQAGNLATGVLRIGAVAEFHLARILQVFCSRYPGIYIDVSRGNSQELVDELRNYRSDLVLVGKTAPSDEFHSILYAQPRIKIIVHRQHRWAGRADISIRELQDEPMIFREPGSETQRVLEAAAKQAQVRLRHALLFRSREGMIAAVASGLGVAPLAEEQFADLESVRKLVVHDADLHTDVHVLCLQERQDARLIKAFMEIATSLSLDGPRAAA